MLIVIHFINNINIFLINLYYFLTRFFVLFFLILLFPPTVRGALFLGPDGNSIPLFDVSIESGSRMDSGIITTFLMYSLDSSSEIFSIFCIKASNSAGVLCKILL